MSDPLARALISMGILIATYAIGFFRGMSAGEAEERARKEEHGD